MTNIVDQLFPPINGSECCIEYTNLNYWRESLPELDAAMLDLIQNDQHDQPSTSTANA